MNNTKKLSGKKPSFVAKTNESKNASVQIVSNLSSNISMNASGNLSKNFTKVANESDGVKPSSKANITIFNSANLISQNQSTANKKSKLNPTQV